MKPQEIINLAHEKVNDYPEPKLDPRIEIRDSAIEGKGIFAVQHIPMGTRFNYVTEPIDHASVIMTGDEFRLYREECIKAGKQWDAVANGDGTHTVGTLPREADPSNYGNHSCDPNIKPEGDKLVALRDINPGDEITIDYAQFSDKEWFMDCNCGASNCAGIVKGIL